MRSTVGADTAAGGAAGPGAAGVVVRPRLFGRLGTARMSVVSAPAGSGKTVLLRSWLGQAGAAAHAAWVPAGRGEREPQRFWLSVLAALRQTVVGDALVQPLTAAPNLDGWALVERLLADLAPLDDQLWLVVDDVHELGPEALRQLELLIMRAPGKLRFVLATRHDVRLGLHRLRLEGELAEIREPDLRFTVAEAGELFDAAGVDLPDPGLLVERTEGWAAGLRLAALSLAGHPDPGSLAAEFSGTERTVAEYLLAEVLDRQNEQVRRLLLRTSILERVNGELAGLLTGDSGEERVLQDLETANAFVVAVDAARSWFRYHHLFADLLQLELRRAEPDQVAGLHRAAATWFAGNGYPVEAVRHAQSARDWPLAVRLLAGHWPGLYLDGQAGTVHELLAGFPAEATATDTELAAVAAADELAYGSLEAAERYLGSAERGLASVLDARHGHAQLLLGIVRLLAARQRGNLPAVTDEAQRLQAMAEAPEAAQYDSAPATRAALGEDLHALALISLGEAEYWTARFEDASRHLERGIALARRIGRPYLEFTGLAHQAAAQLYRSYARATERGRQAVELAERHGWTDDPAFGVASTTLGLVLAGQARQDEAEAWVRRAERTITAEAAQPAMFAGIRYVRGVVELVRDHDAEALAAFEAAEQLARWLAAPHYLIPRIRALLLRSLLRLGQTKRAGLFLAGLSGAERERGEVRVAAAEVELALGNPSAALAELAALQKGPDSGDFWGFWQVRAGVLEAVARDALGDPEAAATALERALDLAEPDGALAPFLRDPVAGRLLERHARHGTAHAALVADILSLLAGRTLAPSATGPQLETLSDSEVRVLRYLPTNLSMRQIGSELYVSHNTVRTHISHLYAKLGTHTRAEAVARARALGLLAPSPLPGRVTHPD